MRAKAVLGALLLFGAAQGVQAEMFQCHQADGSISFRQEPCPVAQMMAPEPSPQKAPAAAATANAPVVQAPRSPAAASVPGVARGSPAPERLVSVPPTTGAVPSPARQEAGPVRLTKRNRDVLELAAQFERCRADLPGFADKSAAIYAAWTHRQAAVLSEYGSLLAAKLRAGRRGEMTLPLGVCTDDWLRAIEPLTHMPDPRFNSVEKTWQVFMGALMTGDRGAAVNCLAGRAEARWNARVAAMSDDDLRRIGASIRALKVQWGDDYEKEGLVADTENRAVGIAFRNINEEWKITELGGATTVALPLH